MIKWEPIDTFPIQPFNADRWYVSGQRVLVFASGSVSIAQYGYTKNGKGRWKNQWEVCKPTHWMPLPEPPADAGTVARREGA